MSTLPDEPEDDLDDGHHAIAYVAAWITNADTKAGLLSAVLALVVAALTQQPDAIADALPPTDGSDWIAVVMFGLVVLGLATSLALLALALVPRSPTSQQPNRFGYPTLARAEWTHTPAGRRQAASEAWEQAHVLATIVSRKYANLRRATVAVFFTLIASLAWVTVAALTT